MDPTALDPAALEALAQDLEFLARLHDREPEAALLEELASAPVRERLGLVLESAAGREALALLDGALAALGRPIAPATLDELAAEYAAIHLQHTYRAAPSESPWFDREGLERQEAMFAVRSWYRHYGLEVVNWRQRPDDHLVNELLFVAHLLRRSPPEVTLVDAARFLDAHPLRWVPDFCRRVARRCGSAYFAGVALLTDAYLGELRALLEALTGVPRASAPERRSEAVAQPEQRYVPGVAPSW